MSISIIERCVATAAAGAVDYSTAEKAAETAIAEFARLAQSPEMVKVIGQKVYHATGWEHEDSTIEDILAALFREAAVSGGRG